MKNEIESAFHEIIEQRALTETSVLEAIKSALISAYRRDIGIGSAQRVEADIDLASGRRRIFAEKEVVEDVLDPRTEVDLETARFYDPAADYGDTVMVEAQISTKELGRIAAQTAKQVLLQQTREAERKLLYDEYSVRQGELVHGTIQNINPQNQTITINLGRVEAVMPRAQQIPRERYKQHDKVRALILKVEDTPRGPDIVLSRSHRGMLKRLLEYEVPEIYNGQVEIKSIAREAGERSKVAVVALQDGIDPVGACVGRSGQRIINIVKELNNEKIDVVEWSADAETFIKEALNPAQVVGVYLDDDPDNGRTAVVIVADNMLSLAIGVRGQNARLAAKLTGWRIDIKNVSEVAEEALAMIDSPAVQAVRDEAPDMVAAVERVFAKRALQHTVMPEEYRVMERFVDRIQRRFAAERDESRKVRLAEIAAVKATLPTGAFQIPVGDLDLPDAVIDALNPLGNAGEIMLRFLIDEARLHKMLRNAPEDAMLRVQSVLDDLTLRLFSEAEAEAETVVPPAPIAPAASTPPAAAPPVAEAPIEVVDFADALADADAAAERARRAKSRLDEGGEEVVAFDDDADPDDLDKKGGKKKKKGHYLEYDEERGVVVKKRRKGGGGDDWGGWEE